MELHDNPCLYQFFVCSFWLRWPSLHLFSFVSMLCMLIDSVVLFFQVTRCSLRCLQSSDISFFFFFGGPQEMLWMWCKWEVNMWLKYSVFKMLCVCVCACTFAPVCVCVCTHAYIYVCVWNNFSHCLQPNLKCRILISSVAGASMLGEQSYLMN